MFAHNWPTALHSAEQVRAMDAALIAAGTPSFSLMQQAAAACWRVLRKHFAKAEAVTVLAGHGNNAGDGYWLATLAAQAGWQAQVLYVVEPAQLAGDAARAVAAAQAAGVSLQPFNEACQGAGVLVDALLGTGLKGAVREPYATAIRWLNRQDLPVLAVDIPSGLSADSGAVLGDAVRADVTVSFVGLKLGLFTGAGPDHVGHLSFAALQGDGAQAAIAPQAHALTAASTARLAPRRASTHKGQLGHVLIVGGDHGMGGAVILAAQASLRLGAGMVSVATRAEHIAPLLARQPEVMACAVRSSGELAPLLARASHVVLGPGLGQSAWSVSLASAVAASDKAQLWDADALNLLAAGRLAPPQAPWIITPHPGEAARLLALSSAQVQADRPAALAQLTARFKACVLLKGVGTLLGAADAAVYCCPHGHPAMAGPGLGDVLSGALAAVWAQGLAPLPAACLASYLHACAGERLGIAGRGLAAADLVAVMRQLLEEHAPCRS
ncbi:NAD(P)H-hydrate dehydratase [Atopomonas sediminilitoris]|uniref:NAD(P)H-hydrate dehydratase n=1 Tax=Atopomonas sediminilitoris TaxID=2919919 RepID=UPI001F4F0474|nr:NAD(P)H-hydrate dehydratase [Atopomonas sediminilitoris]MCJ8170252.1 NAD(P)H-hydrate dehydratase [Atopomonas sediminilitoris]